jgi:hypothetical protein
MIWSDRFANNCVNKTGDAQRALNAGKVIDCFVACIFLKLKFKKGACCGHFYIKVANNTPVKYLH